MSHTERDSLRATLTSKHDEGLAAGREFIRRNGESEIVTWMCGVMENMESNDAHVALLSHFAMLGLCAAWLSVLDAEEG